MSNNTTVDDTQMARRFNVKVFLICLEALTIVVLLLVNCSSIAHQLLINLLSVSAGMSVVGALSVHTAIVNVYLSRRETVEAIENIT